MSISTEGKLDIGDGDIKVLKQSRIKSILDTLSDFPVFKLLSKAEMNELIQLAASIPHKTLTKILAYGKIQTRGLYEDFYAKNHVMNVRNVLSREFKHPLVKLSLLFHTQQHQFIYPIELIDYVIENEDEFSEELNKAFSTIVRFDDVNSANFFSQFSYEAYSNMMSGMSSSEQSLHRFVLFNIVTSWLFSGDLSMTFGEAVKNGLSLKKVDDSLVQPDVSSNWGYNLMSVYMTGLVAGLDNTIEIAWDEQQNQMYSNLLQDNEDFDITAPLPLYEPENILQLLNDPELTAGSLQRLFNLTAFEFIAYISFFNKSSNDNTSSNMAASNLLDLFDEDFDKFLERKYSVKDETKEEAEEIDRIAQDFFAQVPQAVSNHVVEKSSHYIVFSLFRGALRDIVIFHYYLWFDFFSFPNHELFGSEAIRDCLQLLDGKGEELRDYEKPFYGLDLSMLEVLVKWKKQCEVEGWTVPFSLFYNLYYADGYSILQHVDECRAWFESLL